MLEEKKQRVDKLVSLVEKLDEKDIRLLTFGVEMLQARKLFDNNYYHVKINNIDIKE